MRNLEVFREEGVNLKLDDERKGELMVAATYDAGHERIFFASDAFCVYGINLQSEQEQWAISLMEPVSAGATTASLREEDRVIGMTFLLEKEALALASAAGDILQLNPSSREVELVGAVAGGIVSMGLSPDGELLVVATRTGQLLLMTQDWDVLCEISLDQPPGSSRSGLIPPGGVQISWRGDGKYFATLALFVDPTSGVKIDGTDSVKVWETETAALHSCGELIASQEQALSWSPNGSRIATAHSRSETGHSPVALFLERNGLKRDSFEIFAPPRARVESLQWNSDSELLAILLRCGEWDAVQVWNCNNYHWYLKQERRFLAAEKVNFFWDPEKPLCIMCWTAVGSLQKISLCWKSAVIEGSTAFVIDGPSLLVTPLSLSIIPPPMFSFKISFPSPVHTLATLFENTSRCLIAAGLSDGSLSVIILPEVASWADLEGEEFSACQAESDSNLDFGKLRHMSWLGPKTLVGSFCDRVVRHVPEVSPGIARSAEELLEFHLYLNEGTSESLKTSTSAFSEKWSLKLVNQMSLDQAVVAIAANPMNSSLDASEMRKAEVYVQLVDGSVMSYLSEENNPGSRQSGCTMVSEIAKFSSPSPWMRAITHGSLQERKPVLIGLDEQGRLQVNNQLISSDCTSYTVHESISGEEEGKITHLVFTTRRDTLHVINLEKILSGDVLGEAQDMAGLSPSGVLDVKPTRSRKVKGDNTTVDSMQVRPMWERGARLITTVGGTDVAVVLQTFRGNLETIYPRGLVLGAIAAFLTQENFQEAMMLARRHHINLNVIVDYKGWEEFSQAAETFVKQISSLAHVTELVSALNNENVMESTYKNLIPIYINPITKNNQPVKAGALPFTKKVEGVLNALRTALEREVADGPAKELCILTTLARSDPPRLEAALQRVKALREGEIKGINEGNILNGTENLSAEAAVKHLIWLTDADSVFNVALGLYDLHLAAMVASHCQRDPKEFLPLLEELQNMPCSQMRYTIDCRLGRFESALRNCVEMGNDQFDECIKLVRDNPSLYPVGLQLFKDAEKKSLLLCSWGEHLVDEKKFDEAGATFCACCQFHKALDAYRLGGMWQSVMAMAGRLGMCAAEVRELASEFRDELQAMGRPQEAARLALDYCGDVEGAILLLIEAHEWVEVARLAYVHDKKEMIDTQLVPAVLECARNHLKELDENVEKVGKYLARYLAIHQRRLLMSAKLRTDEEGQEPMDDDAASDISIASSKVSGLSGLSAYTGRSTRANSLSSRSQSGTGSVGAKVGRRQSRSQKPQGGKIRAGSPGEEMALVEHLKGMGLSATALEEQRLLLQALLQLGQESTARRLQHALSHFIAVQEDATSQTTVEDGGGGLLAQDIQGEGPVQSSFTKRPLVRVEDMNWKWEVLREQ